MNHYILQAINAAGKSVYIDDVPNGKKCGCVCKECKGELVAKNGGKIKAHHFAHASGTDSFKCSQTALHLLAKEIIAEERRVPAFVGGNITFVSVASVEQEKNLGDIRPDLYAEHDGKSLAVEIYVSHAVDDAKFAKIQERKLTTFEINLSELDFETKDDVRQAIYDVKNVRLVYDEQFTEKALADKKQFIDKNGKTKAIRNGIVAECPMRIELRGRQTVLSSVDSSLCRKCPFGYKSADEDVVHCVGHLLNAEFLNAVFAAQVWHQNVTLNLDYNSQVSVSEGKIVSLADLADFFTRLTKQKFTVIKPKKKRAGRIR